LSVSSARASEPAWWAGSDAVPADHLVREIDAVLDLSWVHAKLASYYPFFFSNGNEYSNFMRHELMPKSHPDG
jgi:hypothetical protein